MWSSKQMVRNEANSKEFQSQALLYKLEKHDRQHQLRNL